MDSLLSLPDTLSNAACEELLQVVQQAKHNQVILVWPKTTRLIAEPGAAALLIQLLLTLQRQKFKLQIQALDDVDIESRLADFASVGSNLLFLLTASNVCTNQGSDISVSVKKIAYQQLMLVDTNHIESLISDNSILLVCADDTSLGTLSHFYQRSDHERTLKDNISFRSLTEDILNSLGDTNTIVASQEQRNRFNTVLWELFKNTDDHARYSYDGELLSSSKRGLFVRRHLFDPSRLTNSPLKSYATVVAQKYGAATLLEISIFDSGSGLARHWRKSDLNDNVSLKEEYEAVMACLEKHATSTGDQRRGHGLHKVMTELQRVDGFLRIRTGRLSLFRDFIRLGVDEKTHMWDWNTDSPKYTSVCDVAGTLVTAFIPLSLS